ncbi:hypothetical protein ACU4GD_00445 [Cupriavidus basilensis]
MFGGKLEFASAFSGLICRAADLDLPNPIADPVMARHAQRLLRRYCRAPTNRQLCSRCARRSI